MLLLLSLSSLSIRRKSERRLCWSIVQNLDSFLAGKDPHRISWWTSTDKISQVVNGRQIFRQLKVSIYDNHKQPPQPLEQILTLSNWGLVHDLNQAFFYYPETFGFRPSFLMLPKLIDLTLIFLFLGILILTKFSNFAHIILEFCANFSNLPESTKLQELQDAAISLALTRSSSPRKVFYGNRLFC